MISSRSKRNLITRSIFNLEAKVDKKFRVLHAQNLFIEFRKGIGSIQDKPDRVIELKKIGTSSDSCITRMTDTNFHRCTSSDSSGASSSIGLIGRVTDYRGSSPLFIFSCSLQAISIGPRVDNLLPNLHVYFLALLASSPLHAQAPLSSSSQVPGKKIQKTLQMQYIHPNSKMQPKDK